MLGRLRQNTTPEYSGTLDNYPLLPSAYTYQAASHLSHPPLPKRTLKTGSRRSGGKNRRKLHSAKGDRKNGVYGPSISQPLSPNGSSFLRRIQHNLIPPLLATSSDDVAVILSNLNQETPSKNKQVRQENEQDYLSVSQEAAVCMKVKESPRKNKATSSSARRKSAKRRSKTKNAVKPKHVRDLRRSLSKEVEGKKEETISVEICIPESECKVEEPIKSPKAINPLKCHDQQRKPNIVRSPRTRGCLQVEKEEEYKSPVETEFAALQLSDQGEIDAESDHGTIENEIQKRDIVEGLERKDEDSPDLSEPFEVEGKSVDSSNSSEEVEEEEKITDDETLLKPSAPELCFGSDIKGKGLVGLKNLGNTCFMNSSLQCLSNLPNLRNYFLKGKHCEEINDSLSPTKGDVAIAFGRLLLSMWNADVETSVKPTKVKKVVGQVASRFSGYRQHDSQEFLRFFLDALHDDLNRVTERIPYEEIQDIDGESTTIRSLRWWKNYEERNDSEIKDTFSGQLYSLIECQTCGNESTAFDPFMDLSVPIPKTGKNNAVSLEDCLDQFSAEELLTGQEQYYCAKCKEHRDCTKKIRLQRLPEVLVIHLKRFSNTRKLATPVELPVDCLNVEKYCNSDCIKAAESGSAQLSESKVSSLFEYKLVGVVNHMGSLYGGHYTADCFNAAEGKWFNFNDASVSETNVEDISSKNAYVLFYVRKP
eukprot:CAMPEP_0184029050 /NCGR_PEP_ID=MMETSP0955-20130417/40_1 /TAXON_ID=627963 /ORGANISM="Aplanochytrium sp, Strain PBS07" /LENGTH=706 /DNA_ID=CAMNT_0026314015 /DNA_START=306 /DNA_END=2426 /DNA_ORIENTATION=-